jgi:hypothetical protein
MTDTTTRNAILREILSDRRRELHGASCTMKSRIASAPRAHRPTDGRA